MIQCLKLSWNSVNKVWKMHSSNSTLFAILCVDQTGQSKDFPNWSCTFCKIMQKYQESIQESIQFLGHRLFLERIMCHLVLKKAGAGQKTNSNWSIKNDQSMPLLRKSTKGLAHLSSHLCFLLVMHSSQNHIVLWQMQLHSLRGTDYQQIMSLLSFDKIFITGNLILNSNSLNVTKILSHSAWCYFPSNLSQGMGEPLQSHGKTDVTDQSFHSGFTRTTVLQNTQCKK